MSDANCIMRDALRMYIRQQQDQMAYMLRLGCSESADIHASLAGAAAELLAKVLAKQDGKA